MVGAGHLKVNMPINFTRVAQIFQKCRYYLKILGARRMIWSSFSTEDAQILRTAVQNRFARAA